MTNKPDFDQLYLSAESQAGYFTAAQASSAGYSAERLSNGTKGGKFRRVAQGVYRLSHFPASPLEDLFIAWLAVGMNSVISHESALALYGLSDILPADVHLTVPRSASRRRANIRLHTNRLGSAEITTRSGLPVTTVARTLADVARSGLSDELVLQAVREALQRGLVSREQLHEQVKKSGGRIKRLFDKEQLA